MQVDASESDAPRGVEPRKKLAFDQYVTYCAIGGMVVTDQGGIKALTLAQFCDAAGVDEATTWRWKKGVKNFAELVRQRRMEIFPQARETAAWNRMFLIGMSSMGSGAKHGDQRAAVDALKTVLGHFGQLEEPVKRAEVTVHGSAAELLIAARKDGIIEGEVVHAGQADTGTDGPDASALPPAS